MTQVVEETPGEVVKETPMCPKRASCIHYVPHRCTEEYERKHKCGDWVK